MKPKLRKDGILVVIGLIAIMSACMYGAYELSQSIEGINNFIYGITKGVGF